MVIDMNRAIIGKMFEFDAAHELQWHHGQCKNLHGHTYRMEVLVEGELNSSGIVMDYSRMKEIVNSKVISILDHRYLNDKFINPTAELMAKNIFETLFACFKDEGVTLKQIRLWETPTSVCIIGDAI